MISEVNSISRKDNQVEDIHKKVDKEIVGRIHKLLDEKDWTQGKFFKKLELEGCYIGKNFFNANQHVSAFFIYSAAKVLDVSADFLLFESNTPAKVIEPLATKISSYDRDEKQDFAELLGCISNIVQHFK